MPSGANLRAVALFLALTACAAALVVDAGCNAYATARETMPPLDNDERSVWIAVLGASMTRVCR